MPPALDACSKEERRLCPPPECEEEPGPDVGDVRDVHVEYEAGDDIEAEAEEEEDEETEEDGKRTDVSRSAFPLMETMEIAVKEERNHKKHGKTKKGANGGQGRSRDWKEKGGGRKYGKRRARFQGIEVLPSDLCGASTANMFDSIKAQYGCLGFLDTCTVNQFQNAICFAGKLQHRSSPHGVTASLAPTSVVGRHFRK